MPTMKRFLRTRADRLAGLTCAFIHVAYVGAWIQSELQAFWGGLVPDLEFHGLSWIGIDWPIFLVLDLTGVFGLGYHEGDVRSYVATDVALLVLGTVYWFFVGSLFSTLFSGWLRETGRRAMGVVKGRTRLVLLCLIVAYLLLQVSYFRAAALALVVFLVAILPLVVIIAGLFTIRGRGSNTTSQVA